LNFINKINLKVY